MYEWLEDELAKVGTPKFHCVGGRGPLATGVSRATLPPSYVEFLECFGEARLYRELSYWKIGVRPKPVKEIINGREVFRIGHYDSNGAYFDPASGDPGCEWPVFELRGARIVPAANSFDEWLVKRSRTAKRTFSAKEWRAILVGPAPFTAEELKIVEARKRFECVVVGTAKNGQWQFDVRNNSRGTLPYLTLEVVWKDGSLIGGVWLPVSHVRPGQRALVAHEGCKGASLSDVDIAKSPDPTPSDRDRYWEFRATSQ